MGFSRYTSRPLSTRTSGSNNDKSSLSQSEFMKRVGDGLEQPASYAFDAATGDTPKTTSKPPAP